MEFQCCSSPAAERYRENQQYLNRVIHIVRSTQRAAFVKQQGIVRVTSLSTGVITGNTHYETVGKAAKVATQHK